MDTIDQSIFKAYDIRGIYPTSLNEELAYKIAKAYVAVVKPTQVILGRDGRISGPALHQQVVAALTDMGVDVIDIGMVSSDMYYYACATKQLPGMMITASHNPKEYNGFKMVKQIPYFLTGDEGIKEIKDMILADNLPENAATKGTVETWPIMDEFIEYILKLIDPAALKPLHVIADTANGMVGPIIDAIGPHLPNIKFTPMYFEPDGNFPNHGGDPLQAENRQEIEARVPQENADLGVMFDPDGDRFFVIDQKGRFLPGDFMTAIFAEHFLKKSPGAKIVYDIRASEAVADTVNANGGVPLYNRVGHSYIKKRMIEEKAVFAGEVTGHYYFADFFYCDSGIVTLLYLIEYLSQTTKPLHQIIDELEQKYFISGEINSKVEDIPKILQALEDKYGKDALDIIKIDGVTMEMGEWRFNVRASNTEPLIRLNLEAKTKQLMEQQRDELLTLIRS